MDCIRHLTGTSGAPVSDTIEDHISPAILQPTLPSAKGRNSPRTAENPPSVRASPYTRDSLEDFSNSSATKPTPTKSNNMVIVCGPEHAADACWCLTFEESVFDTRCSHSCLPLASFRHTVSPNSSDSSRSLYSEASERALSPQLCDQFGDDDPATRDQGTFFRDPITTYCATLLSLALNSINCHIHPDNHLYRWQPDNPIPIGINFSSFKSGEDMLLVKTCLKFVLHKFNFRNVGPKFFFVSDPSVSAFFVTFVEDDRRRAPGDRVPLAKAFFPSQDANEWFIYLYSGSLTLNEHEEDSLSIPRSQAVEQKLIMILTHELLHVLGVRHCDAHVIEKGLPCIRFPSNLSDEEHHEPLMDPSLPSKQTSQPQLDWKDSTVEAIQQLYDVRNGGYVEGHKVRDVRWQAHVKEKEKQLRNNALVYMPHL